MYTTPYEKTCEACGRIYRKAKTVAAITFNRQRFCRSGCAALRPAIERFLEKVKKDTSSGCWEWLGGKRPSGYGCFRESQKGSRSSSHQFAYEYFKGPIPEGKEIDHICNNRGCCNPDHLQAVTHKENQRKIFERHLFCRRGHEFGPLDVYRGRRHCRKCAAEAQKVLRAKRLGKIEYETNSEKSNYRKYHLERDKNHANPNQLNCGTSVERKVLIF